MDRIIMGCTGLSGGVYWIFGEGEVNNLHSLQVPIAIYRCELDVSCAN